jgi:D-alanyl-D-alanine carboxypeptidase
MTGRVAAVALGAVLAAQGASAQSPALELASLLGDMRAEYGFPGATAAIALPAGEIVEAATGMADMEAGTPMTPDSRMLAASIGKSFVAATVLALESDGVLQRDDRVADHLGAHAWFARLPNHADMTVDHLLRHTSGLPDHVHLPAFQSEMAARVAAKARAPTPEQSIAFVLGAEPLFPAGEGWGYSDTGYLLLGLIVERATGEAYHDLVATRILRPLGLGATTPSDTRRIDGLAVGYTTDANHFGLPTRTIDASGRLTWDPAAEWTGGGFVSTSRDLAAWGHALFGGTALKAPYLERLLEGVPVSPDAPDILYGAGVAIHADTTRGPVLGHGGWIPGYVSSLRHYGRHGATVAFQINTDVGIADDTTDLVPALEAALADLAIAWLTDGAVPPDE